MNNIKRLMAAAIAGVLIISAAACSDSSANEYPVKIAGHTFDAKPESVVCLSDSVADILIACGYADAIIAKTDECDQEELDNIPSVGARDSISVQKIASVSPDVVFTDRTVPEEVLEELNEDDYNVLNMIKAHDSKELSILYESISAVMGGNETGRENGEKKASSLLQSFDAMERTIPDRDENEAQITACYLYDVDGTAATDDAMCGQLFNYAKVLNVCAASETSLNTSEAIKLSNPNYIFCDVGVKKQIMSDERYKNLDAVKNKKVYEIDAKTFDRQGDSMTEVLSFIIQTIYPELKSQTNEESIETSESSEVSETSAKEESKNESSKTEKTTKVKADNSLEITDDMEFGQGDENEAIKNIQQRLKDLGYGKFEDGITDYFGEKTAKAFKAFQKKNGLDQDGYASAEALRLLFSDKAKAAG